MDQLGWGYIRNESHSVPQFVSYGKLRTCIFFSVLYSRLSMTNTLMLQSQLAHSWKVHKTTAQDNHSRRLRAVGWELPVFHTLRAPVSTSWLLTRYVNRYGSLGVVKCPVRGRGESYMLIYSRGAKARVTAFLHSKKVTRTVDVDRQQPTPALWFA